MKRSRQAAPARRATGIALAGAIALGALGSCAGSESRAADPREFEERSERQDYDDLPEEETGPGWRWEGQRQQCFYLHENECFAYFDEACEAAGCDEAACEHDDAAPANVRCTVD